jgi:hypothetical protein
MITFVARARFTNSKMTSEHFDESHEKTGNLKAMFEKKAEEQAPLQPPPKTTAPKTNKFGSSQPQRSTTTNTSTTSTAKANKPTNTSPPVKSPEPSVQPEHDSETTTHSHLNKFKQMEQEAEKVCRFLSSFYSVGSLSSKRRRKKRSKSY